MCWAGGQERQRSWAESAQRELYPVQDERGMEESDGNMK